MGDMQDCRHAASTKTVRESNMKTNRRDFFEAMGAGAVGLGLAAAAPSVAAQAKGPAKTGGTRKMVVRADDIGHSKVCNIGSFEAIDRGVVTAAAVMLDSPGTEDALERLKAFPWISVEWHTHMWGAPVLDPKQVPSLVEKGGEFAGRFRLDLSQASDVVYDEAVKELRAQLDRCIWILGKVPDTGGGGRGNSPWGKAMSQVANEFGLVTNFTINAPPNEVFQTFRDKYLKHISDAQQAGEEWAKHYPASPSNAGGAGGRGGAAGQPGAPNAGAPDPRFASRKIIMPVGTMAYGDLLTDSISKVEKEYDPVLFYTEDRAGILKYPEDMIFAQAWHPGYVDYYVYRLGERGNRARAQQFVIGRTQDVVALCDVRLKNWIKENHIELVNFRDALYGTREYQNHLKLIGSDLCMI
jgi:chitin disaccharide deacetylase